MLGCEVDERAEATSKGRHGRPYLKTDTPGETVDVLALDPQGKEVVATLGVASDANVRSYSDEHRIFNGIMMLTGRRAYRLDAEGNPLKAPVCVGLDISPAEFQ
jgi:hypothetical protein